MWNFYYILKLFASHLFITQIVTPIIISLKSWTLTKLFFKFLAICFSFYLKKERERKQGGWEMWYHPITSMDSLPNYPQQSGWARLVSGAQNSIWVSHLGVGTKYLNYHFCLPECVLAGSWIGSKVAGVTVMHSDMECWHPDWWLCTSSQPWPNFFNIHNCLWTVS